MKTPMFAACLACALPLSAAAEGFESRLQTFHAAFAERRAQAEAVQESLEQALSTTLTAMRDGVEVGGQVVGFIDSQGLKVVFKRQTAFSALEGRTIALSDSLPAYPRVLGPLVAREASALMTAGMPQCAEKAYMRRSIEVRTWLELGGDASLLPVVEPLTGYKDESSAARWRVWLDNGSETALELIGKAEVLRELAALDIKKEVMDRAEKRFVDFLLAENEWRRNNPR